MKRTLLALCAAITVSAYGHGYSISTIEEVHGKVDYIHAVKVTKVTKPKAENTGTKPYPVTIEFEIIETLKGAATKKTTGVYTLPAIERKMKDGTTLRSWIKVLASGKELSVKKGQSYLIYGQKPGIEDKKVPLTILRIDPISEKQNLLDAMKKAKENPAK